MILSTYRRLLSFRLSPPIYQYSVRITIIGNKKKIEKKTAKNGAAIQRMWWRVAARSDFAFFNFCIVKRQCTREMCPGLHRDKCHIICKKCTQGILAHITIPIAFQYEAVGVYGVRCTYTDIECSITAPKGYCIECT